MDERQRPVVGAEGGSVWDGSGNYVPGEGDLQGDGWGMSIPLQRRFPPFVQGVEWRGMASR